MWKIVEKWGCCGVLIGGGCRKFGELWRNKKMWLRICVDKIWKV